MSDIGDTAQMRSGADDLQGPVPRRQRRRPRWPSSGRPHSDFGSRTAASNVLLRDGLSTSTPSGSTVVPETKTRQAAGAPRREHRRDLPAWSATAPPSSTPPCPGPCSPTPRVASSAGSSGRRTRSPDYRLYEVVVDAADPAAIAGWWADVLGLEPVDGEDGAWSIGPGAGLPWELVFGAVPEPKTVKNRIHWDVWGETSTLLAAGATLLRARDGQLGARSRTGRSAGTCSPIPRATSSACSPGTEPPNASPLGRCDAGRVARPTLDRRLETLAASAVSGLLSQPSHGLRCRRSGPGAKEFARADAAGRARLIDHDHPRRPRTGRSDRPDTPALAASKDPALATKLGKVMSDKRVKNARRRRSPSIDTTLGAEVYGYHADTRHHAGVEHQDRHGGHRDARARTVVPVQDRGHPAWPGGQRCGAGSAVSQGLRRSDLPGVGLRLARPPDQGAGDHARFTGRLVVDGSWFDSSALQPQLVEELRVRLLRGADLRTHRGTERRLRLRHRVREYKPGKKGKKAKITVSHRPPPARS